MPGIDIPDFAGTIQKARQQQLQEEAQRWSNFRDQAQVGQKEHELHNQDQQLQQQGDHQRFEDQRQQLADTDAVHKRAQELTDAGMPLQAQQYLAIHGYQPQQPQSGTDVPGSASHEQAHGAESHQPGNELMQPQAEQLPGPATGAPSQPSGYEGGGLDHFDINQASQNLGGVGQPVPWQAPIQGPPAPAPQPQPMPPHVETMVSPPTPKIAAYRGPNGQTMQFDPGEARRAEQERNQYRAMQYKAAMQGTPLAETAGEFSGLLAAGEDIKPSDVVGLQKAEMTAKAKTAEEAAKEQAKLTEEHRSKADVETQSRWQHERNLAIMAGQGGGGGMPNPKVYNAWESHKQHAKTDGLYKQVVQTNSMLDRIDSELSNQNNPLSQAMAIHSAAALSTSMGASGGRVTVQASRDIKDAYGALESFENKVYRAAHGGANMPSIVAKAQGAMQNLRGVNQAQGATLFRGYQRTAGTTSDWMNDPSMAPRVADEEAATKIELGLPEDYGDNGEANHPPVSPPARHAKPGHASHAAQPPQEAKPQTLHGPGGKTLTLGADGMYH